MPQNRQGTGTKNPVAGSEATRWKPGQSGNPGGRPRTAAFSQACREKLSQLVPDDPAGRTYAQVIAEALAQRALKGDIRAAQELADRAEGKARQSVEIENTTQRAAFERMSETELEAYVRDGVLPEWFPQQEEQNDETIQ